VTASDVNVCEIVSAFESNRNLVEIVAVLVLLSGAGMLTVSKCFCFGNQLAWCYYVTVIIGDGPIFRIYRRDLGSLLPH